MVSSTCLKETLVVYNKDMSIYCEVCECNIKKSNWGKHLRTKKHGIACGDIVVEEVEKKQCCKCGGHKVLEMFSGENATCNVCLAHRKNGQIITQKKLGSCRGNMGKNIRRKRRHIIKNIIRGK